MILFKLFGIIDVRPADILDVLLISIIIYYIFLLFRGTRAAQMKCSALSVRICGIKSREHTSVSFFSRVLNLCVLLATRKGVYILSIPSNHFLYTLLYTAVVIPSIGAYRYVYL